MRRKTKHGLVGALVQAPWWVGITIAGFLVVFFSFVFERLYLSQIFGNPAYVVFDALLHGEVGRFFALALVMICVVCSGLSGMRSLSRAMLFQRQKDINSLKGLSWQSFERMVGEAYKRDGYKVQETGLGGADGGVDLVLWRDGAKTLVQCKRWRDNSVGAAVVREMYGLMAHHRAKAVKIVCASKFTKEAREFAKGKPIELVDGEALFSLVRRLQ